MTTYYLNAAEGDCVYVVFVYGWNTTVPGSIRDWHAGTDKRGHLVRTERPVSHITATRPTFTSLGFYDLDDPDLASVALPAEITVDEWKALPDSRQELYHQRSLRGEETIDIDVSHHVPITMTAMPPGRLPLNWKPSAWADIYGPALAHQVPGVLTGYRSALVALGKTFGDCYDSAAQGTKPIPVRIKSFWSPRRVTTEGKGRARQTRETWTTATVDLDGADVIPGNTLAEAQALWDAGIEDARALMSEYSTAHTCGRCDGRGFIPGFNRQKGNEYGTTDVGQ